MAVDPELHARAVALAALTDLIDSLRRQQRSNHPWSREYWISREWFALATRDFHEPLSSLSDRVRQADGEAIEVALTYLETAPRCFRSGYVAEHLMRRLSRAPLTKEQRERATSVVVAETAHRQSRGWNDIGALAGGIWDEELRAALLLIEERGGVEGYRASKIASAATRWRSSTSAV